MVSLLCGIWGQGVVAGNEDVELIEAENREVEKIGRRWSEGTNLWLWRMNAPRELIACCLYLIILY